MKRIVFTLLWLGLMGGFWFLPLAHVQAPKSGTIVGKIHFTGPPPKLQEIVMVADMNCRNLNKGQKVYQEDVVVNKNKTLKNVFVHIKKGLEGRKFQPPAKPVVLDQRRCLFHPRVLGMMVGQTLITRNSDPTLHNVRLMSKKGNAFNVAQPIQGMETRKVLKAPEVMIRVRCDVHAWMVAWLGVVPHPYFDVTDETGTFELKNVPPGRYQIQAWQEKYGAKTQMVEVKPGARVVVDFTYTGQEKAELNPGFVIQDLVLEGHAAKFRFIGPPSR